MQWRKTTLVTLVLAVCAAGLVQAQRGRGQQWMVLGQRAVSDKADHDTIPVTAARGTFTAIKFEVQRHAVDFHRVVIHFTIRETNFRCRLKC